ncbi:glutamate--tRNA ligase [Candidatus Binatia bacterium]|jgi:glutamyl-tRNA synthetase|nr:glutamate--tRNA ligase [Candidatus Binatia bacterium]
MASVRTRFAPSPTGALHVGGVRTALFSYLYARHFGGRFVLRIEDTDRQRSTQAWVDEIVGALRWLDLEWDEGPFFQTERMDLYRETIERLLSDGRAYRCTCTPDELEAKRKVAMQSGGSAGYDRHCRPGFGPGPDAGRPAAIRFAMPTDGEAVIEDLVKDKVVFRNADVDDFVIARSDGWPTYNLVVTVDDADMAISHVIRGDDLLPSTPKQIALYHALGAPVPSFAHLPQVLGVDRARLSKRHAATAVTSYRELGYYPDALVNFLARLGWSHGDQEVFSRKELIHAFSLESVGKSAGVFNLEKLDWLNFQYLKARSPEQLAGDLRPFMASRGIVVPGDDAWLAKMAGTLRERAKTLGELTDMASFYLADEITLDEKAVAKFLKPEAGPLLAALVDRLTALPVWDPAAIEGVFTGLMTETGVKLGALAQPVRVAVSGGTVSPGIYEVLDVLGRERSLRRLRNAIEIANAAAGH